MILVWTGHTPAEIGGYAPCEMHDKVRAAMREKTLDLRPARVFSGMALGVDQWGAQVAVDLGIPFTAAVPFAGQESVWPPAARREYHRLLKLAAKVVYVSDPPYSPEKMQARNAWMCDRISRPDDRLVAVWTGAPGGTANTVAYAIKKRIRWERIDPREL